MRSLSNFGKLLLTASAITLFSCQKEQVINESTVEPAPVSGRDQSTLFNTFKGPQVEMGTGYARSWITVSHTDVPVEIGIEMTAEAITSMSAHSALFVLPLHNKAIQTTVFEHIGLNWNLHGHPPVGTFSVPHFDFHFYSITNEERLAIPAFPLAPAAFNNLPPAGYMPLSYNPDPGGVPQMGKHWGDGSVVPGTFSHTMIYGSYNGEVVFTEPMITRSRLLNGPAFSVPFAQPTLFAEDAYYPTKYNYYINNGKYYVTLSDFVWRQ